MAKIAYLDTNILIRIAAGKQIRPEARDVFNRSELLISGMVLLELQMLYEAGKLSVSSSDMWKHLSSSMNITMCKLSMTDIMRTATQISWTREPGDRVIVANAIANQQASLITTDRKIWDNYPQAIRAL